MCCYPDWDPDTIGGDGVFRVIFVIREPRALVPSSWGRNSSFVPGLTGCSTIDVTVPLNW